MRQHRTARGEDAFHVMKCMVTCCAASSTFLYEWFKTTKPSAFKQLQAYRTTCSTMCLVLGLFETTWPKVVVCRHHKQNSISTGSNDDVDQAQGFAHLIVWTCMSSRHGDTRGQDSTKFSAFIALGMARKHDHLSETDRHSNPDPG